MTNRFRSNACEYCVLAVVNCSRPRLKHKSGRTTLGNEGCTCIVDFVCSSCGSCDLISLTDVAAIRRDPGAGYTTRGLTAFSTTRNVLLLVRTVKCTLFPSLSIHSHGARLVRLPGLKPRKPPPRRTAAESRAHPASFSNAPGRKNGHRPTWVRPTACTRDMSLFTTFPAPVYGRH